MDPAVNLQNQSLQKSCRSLLQCGEKSLLCRLFSTQHLCLWRTVCSTLDRAICSSPCTSHLCRDSLTELCVQSQDQKLKYNPVLGPASLNILNRALFRGCHILSLHPCVVLSGVQLFILFSRNAIRRPLKSCKRVTKILQHSKAGCRNRSKGNQKGEAYKIIVIWIQSFQHKFDI